MQRKVGDGLFDEGDGFLQIVAVFATDAHGVALDTSLHLQFAVLEVFHDLLGQFDLNARLHLTTALDLVAADLFDLVANFHAFDVHTALGEPAVEDVLHLVQLKLIVRPHCEFQLGLFNARIRTFEVETRTDFFVRLLDGILDFGFIYF